MYVSNVIDVSAERMASSIAGKISAPFWSAVIRFPSVMDGPSMTPISRRNWGPESA
jgi:hypothetical protein